MSIDNKKTCLHPEFAERIRPWFPEDSYRKVSRRIGISQETVRGWLSGWFLPNSKNLNILANYTKKSETWLLTGREPESQTHLVSKGDDDYVEYLKRYIVHLEEENKRLKDEISKMPATARTMSGEV